jgi:UDP-N-acetylglucosamine--N-acetylmuramyl-(pentapeptide) pyrophosphoryl-undecaprenol N-acetylglucosamine transferase
MRETSNKKIIFTGGGTWGHITPIISLYNYLWVDGKYEYMWLWERDSLEEKIALENDIEFHDISAGKIRRYFDIRNFYEPLKNFTGVFESLYYILKYKGDIVFSKGGFVSVPACIAGFVLRKKIYIHESDSVMGLANKITSKFATKVFYSFKNNKTEIENNKHIHSWAIVNPEMLDEVKSIDKTENERLTVLVIAGSQWSENIFNNLLKILPDCSDIDFNVILGTNENTELQIALEDFDNVTAHGFLSQKKLAKLYIKSDIAITRGSSTLWELFYFGIHSIIIPLKATGGNHQYHNGVYFNENYSSDILDEDENLNLEMFRKLQKYKDLRKTGLNLEGFLDGLKTIKEEIED